MASSDPKFQEYGHVQSKEQAWDVMITGIGKDNDKHGSAQEEVWNDINRGEYNRAQSAEA